MAVNDRSMFSESYISWADTHRRTLAKYQGKDRIFSPAVNPYKWPERSQYTKGSPEGKAFAVQLYAAYRDFVQTGVCATPSSIAHTISKPGISPVDIVIFLHAPVTGGTGAAAPKGSACGSTTVSCDTDGCAGAFSDNILFFQGAYLRHLDATD